jgi:ferric-dicitrate binding protein FerR (iron transport regulator)
MSDSLKKRINEYVRASNSLDEEFVLDSYLDSENEDNLKNIAKEHWEKSSSSKIDLRHVLNSVHFYINSKSNQTSTKTKFLQTYYRAAAMLLIPLFIASLYLVVQNYTQAHTYAQIEAPRGSRVHFSLPDGSIGYLNGGSQMKYSTNFTKERNVILSGEGYFEVEKDKDHPFTVETEHAKIQVLGTKFDVCAYPKDNEVITTLEEGEVQITSAQDKQKATLQPGEQNRLNIQTGEMVTSNVDTKLYTSWKEQILRFDNATFYEVVKKMERWYGVNIKLDRELFHGENYTLTIKTESLREMLQLLSITAPIEYSIKEDHVEISQKVN